MSEPPVYPAPDGLDVVQDVQDNVVAGPGGMQPSRKRARKSCEGEAGPSETRTVAKPKRKGRQTAGMLSELMNMPLDVFFEGISLPKVASHLHPLDMLHLSRTAKSLRSLVLAKSSRSAWIASFATVLGLPSCPENMNYKSAQKFVLSTKRTGRNKYYAEKVTATLNEVLALFAQEDRQGSSLVIREMLANVASAHLHAFDVLIWFKERSLLKQLANQDTMEDRKSKITEQLKELGYTEDDFPEDEEAWDKLVDQPRPLTDRIWNNIRPKLEELLTFEKERRAQQAIADHVNHRLDVLVEWFEDYVQEHFTDDERGLMPNRHDARELPSLVALALADDAQGDVSREAFLAATEQMLADAEAYKTRAKRELADILCNHSAVKCLKLHDRPADDILRGPLAYFRCAWRCVTVTAVDGCRFLTYEQLHAHWREEHPDHPWLRQGDEDHRYIAVGVPELGSDSVPSVARSALFAAPIKLDTQREVLDGWVREGRLFCTCEHPSLPPPGEMSWAKLLFHLLCQSHEDGERAGEKRRLHGKYNPNHVLRYPHSLVAGYGCCIKFLPADADTAMALVRTAVDDACRAQIEERLAMRPDPGAVAVCRICKGLSRKTPLQVRRRLRCLRLPERPEEIVWHLRRCHDKEFEKRDILFVSL
ncbi:hypothetical protein GSI_03171 [Ganoderma sinense ZZ0214-1]|uniref:F-box domain-containing protein n=1 Tax=Ganoderma sinense ZZ0214-1 TaxID=1077348 RepID=A0A2G8SKV1_9APHY|nr:hypothetical protein GSI_03171 [Ganoderma sinense ZZ0214-1]